MNSTFHKLNSNIQMFYKQNIYKRILDIFIEDIIESKFRKLFLFYKFGKSSRNIELKK